MSGCVVRKVAYSGHDNATEIVLMEKGDLAKFGTVTRMVLALDDTQSIDSQSAADLFDWGQGDGVLAIYVGRANPTPGSYPSVRLVVYRTESPNGLVWIGPHTRRRLNIEVLE